VNVNVNEAGVISEGTFDVKSSLSSAGIGVLNVRETEGDLHVIGS
jgi:hypothetical protein